MSTNIPAFAKLKMPDQLLQRFQTNIDATLTPLAQLPVAQSIVTSFTTTDLVKAGTDFIVKHGLGRTPSMVLPGIPTWAALNGSSGANSGATFAVSPSSNPSPSTQSILRCSVAIQANASLTFLVF